MANAVRFAKSIPGQSIAAKYMVRKGRVKKINTPFRTKASEGVPSRPIDITSYNLDSQATLEAQMVTVKFAADGTFRVNSREEITPPPTLGQVTWAKNTDPTTGRALVTIPEDLWQGVNPPLDPAVTDQIPLITCWLGYEDAMGNEDYLIIEVLILRGAS